MNAAADTTLRRADLEDVLALSEALAEAFDGYPLTEWVVLDDAARAARRRRYFELFLRHGAHAGEIDCAADKSGAALWFGPEAWQVGLPTLLARLPGILRVTGLRRAVSRLRGLRRLAGDHPTEPHWYLEVIGVRTARQNQGLGSALLRAGLERAEADGAGAYVVTSSEGALPFYRSHGFALREVVSLDDGPDCWCLWRDR